MEILNLTSLLTAEKENESGGETVENPSRTE